MAQQRSKRLEQKLLCTSMIFILFFITVTYCLAATISNTSFISASSLFTDNNKGLALQLAESNFRQGYWQRAKHYASQIDKNPRAQELLAAIDALGGNKTKTQAFLSNLKDNQSSAMVDFIEGVLAAQTGSMEKATNYLQTALDRNSSHPVFLYYLGNIYLNQGNNDKAEELFIKALNISPFLAEAQAGMGQIETKKNNPDLAAQWFKKATDNAPEVMAYHLQLISIYKQTDNKKKYNLAIKQMLYHTPGVKQAMLKKGMLVINSGDYSKAIEEMDKALKIYKNIPQAHYIKAVALINLGNRVAAQESLNSFLLANWGDPLTHHYAGMCYLALDDLDNAQMNFQKAIDINPNFGKSFIPLTIIEQKKGKYSHALEGLNLTLKNGEPPELVYYFIGHIKLAQNDISGYKQAMLKTVNLIPGLKEENTAISPSGISIKDFATNRNLLALYFYNGWYGKTLEISQNILKHNSDDCFALYFNALSNKAQHKKEIAKHMIERLKILNPNLKVNID